jgi:hypothetical protein
MLNNIEERDRDVFAECGGGTGVREPRRHLSARRGVESGPPDRALK